MSAFDRIKRGMPRNLIFAMIPLGFVILVLLMIIIGENDPVPDGDLVTDEVEVGE